MFVCYHAVTAEPTLKCIPTQAKPRADTSFLNLFVMFLGERNY